MTKWIFGMVLAGLWATTASAELPDPSKVRFAGNNFVPGGQGVALGNWLVDHKVHTTKASYSVLKDGSVLQNVTLALRGVDGKPAVVPAGAIIKGAMIDVLTPLAGTASVSTSIGVNAAGDTWPLGAASTLGTVAGVKTGMQSSVLPMKLTAKKNISLAVSGGHLTTGKFNVLVEYYLSDPN